MVVITVQAYVEARVHTRNVENKKLFWVNMIDVQKGLGIKTISDLVRKTSVVSLKQNLQQKNRSENIKDQKLK